MKNYFKLAAAVNFDGIFTTLNECSQYESAR